MEDYISLIRIPLFNIMAIIIIYGVASIFNNPLNQTTFDQFFQYPYYIYDIPNDIKYNPASEIGFHIGWKKKSKYYLDINFSDIKIH